MFWADWWARSDLNREPKHYECSALTIELQAHARTATLAEATAHFKSGTARLRQTLRGSNQELEQGSFNVQPRFTKESIFVGFATRLRSTIIVTHQDPAP